MKLLNEINNMLWNVMFDVQTLNILNENIIKKLISEKERDEYIERVEIWDLEQDPGHPSEMKVAYSKIDNSYIGTVKETKKMIKNFGLSKIQKAMEDHNVASIGYVASKNEYAGWSHRAIQSFGIGDMLFDEKFKGKFTEQELEKLPFKKRGSIVIAKMEQAKQAAINFARHVS